MLWKGLMVNLGFFMLYCLVSFDAFCFKILINFLLNSMAALLSKFRIKFHEIIVINMLNIKPQAET
jgi:hypothetical protein